MAINFGNGFGNAQNPTTPSPATGVLNLNKNDILNLTKKEPGLQYAIVGAGWDLSQTGQDFDLDIAAFLLDQNGKINPQTAMDQVVFFNNKQLTGIQLMGDNRTGAGEGDDEQINVDLLQIPAHISKIVFLVTIHEAAQRRQTFGMVENAYVRIVNQQNEREICRFNLRDSGSTGTSVVFAELSRNQSEWEFKAVGDVKMADLNGLLSLYM
ncbi:MAG: TerD family protein [Culicoidibacterales bacterium]